MAEPFDLDAGRAARAEAAGAPFPFRFAGTDYTIPAPKQWPLDVTDLLAENKVAAALRALLGDDDYDRFTGAGATLADVEALFGAVGRWQGLDGLGE